MNGLSTRVEVWNRPYWVWESVGLLLHYHLNLLTEGVENITPLEVGYPFITLIIGWTMTRIAPRLLTLTSTSNTNAH